MSVTGTGKKGVSFLLSTSSAVESQDESTLPLFFLKKAAALPIITRSNKQLVEPCSIDRDDEL